LLMQVSLPAAGYGTPERVAAFYSALQRALQQRLGPHTVAIVDEAPLTGDRGRARVALPAGDRGREAVVRAASADYFAVMRMPLSPGGRLPDDAAGRRPRGAVISQSLAARLFAGEPPVGRRISLAAPTHMVEVVGVVGDVRHRALDEPLLPTVYLPAQQSPSPSSIIVVRSPRPAADLIALVRGATGRLDANLPVYWTRPMREVLAASPGVPVRRVLTAAFTAFALLALILSAIGVFGVTAHDVASRRSELALRIALGA